MRREKWPPIFRSVKSISILTLLCACYCGCGTLSRSASAVSGKIKKLNSEPGSLKTHQHALDQNGENAQSLSALSRNTATARVTSQQVREEDIVWADPDPDVPIAELENVLIDDQNPVDSWYEDYGKAIKKARLEGKPVMIWFTSTRNSPLSQRLGEELFVQREFQDWADKELIRLRVDANIKEKDTAKRRKRQKYVNELKKRYKALGHPVVVVISPRGTEFGKYRGYKPGSADFYFGRLKNAARIAKQDQAEWQAEMEAKGYRAWRDSVGRGVFARIIRYRDGNIWLVSPDGKRSKTSVNKLSTEDRQYIERKIAESKAKKKR